VSASTGGTFNGQVTFGANVIANGTVDGRDIAADGTKLDGIATGATNYVHPATHPVSMITGLQAELDAIDTDLLSDTTPQLGGNLDVNGFTIDGRDIATDGTKLDGVATGATNVSNNNQLTNGAGYLTSSSSLNSSNLSGALPSISGANLTGIVSVPQGVIVMWSGQTSQIPTGWALCDGSNGTPNLIDKFIMGASSSNETTTGGANSRTLSTANLPSHTHSFSGTTNTTGNHNHSGSTNTTGNHHHLMVTNAMSNQRAQYSITTNSGNYLAGAGGHGYELYYLNGHTSAPNGGKTSTSGNHSHSLSINNNGNHSHTMSGTTGASGSGTAFDNKPAYMALAYIMKT